jgi:phage-related protein
MFKEITDFKVRLFSKDGVNSEVLAYLDELVIKNPNMALKAITSLSDLPNKIYLNKDIKAIKTSKAKLYEIRIQSKNDICRFFFVIERPNVIVLYGFTKKTQKTDVRDINTGLKAYEIYQENKKTIPFDLN